MLIDLKLELKVIQTDYILILTNGIKERLTYPGYFFDFQIILIFDRNKFQILFTE